MPYAATTPTSVTDLIKSVAFHISGHSQFAKFKKLYRSDRIAYVFDCLPSLAKTLAPYQEEILGYFDEGKNRVAVRGPHGLGKTALASVIVHHSVLTAESDCKVPTTASAWRQLDKYLWPEIHKSSRFLDWIEIGREIYTRDELLSTSIKLDRGLIEAFAVASDDHTTIEGAHATRMVYVFDEAKMIPRATWDAAEGAFSSEGLELSDYQRGIASKETNKDESINSESILSSNSGSIAIANTEVLSSIHSSTNGGSNSNNLEIIESGRGNGREKSVNHSKNGVLSPSVSQSYKREAIEDHRVSSIISTSQSIYEAIAFAISTPGDPSGQFYDIHMHRVGYEDWYTRHVTLEEAMLAGRISPKWAEQRAKQWGIDSSVYQNRVLGEFADNTEDGIIPMSWVRAAVDRWKEHKDKGFVGVSGKQTLGVDVARSGEDKTVIAVRNGAVITKLHIYSKLLTTMTAGHVKSLARGHTVNIEITGGLGAAVYDILKEQDVGNLRAVDVSGKTFFHDRSGELSFLNVRAGMWWHMRELLDPTYHSEIALPDVEALVLDLITPRWSMQKDATVKLESKEEIEKRLGRSTDYGDAVCLAFWQSSSGGGVVF